jgi:hypothetical protein
MRRRGFTSMGRGITRLGLGGGRRRIPRDCEVTETVYDWIFTRGAKL